MQELDVVYESQELFPLFANRLLQKERHEYRDFLHWLDVRESEDDPLALLARTGGARETDSLMMFPCPERTPLDMYQTKFFAQGLRYLPDYAVRAASDLPPQARLFLMPDPQNDRDRLAIGLRTDDPKALVGYCPRYLTDVFRFLLRTSPNDVKVVAERVNPNAPIQLRLLCSLTAPWPKGFNPCSSEDFQALAHADSATPRPALA